MIIIIVLLVIILIILLRYECLTIDDEPLNNLVTQINNKELTIDKLNTSNIANKELITSNNITSSEGTIDKLTVNNQLTSKTNLNGYNIYSSYITNYGTIKSSDLISHHNVTYLFDTNATLYLGKIQDQTIRTNAVHKCCAFGYYNISNGYAVISTSHVQVRFNNSVNNWICMFGFTINGINFKCLSDKYGYLYGNDNTWFSNSSNFAYNNDPLLPPVVGKFECSYFTGKRYRSSPDTDDFYHNALFPYGVQGYYNNKSYHLYMVRAENCDDRGTGVDRLIIKITDCLMIKSSDGF